MSSTPKSKLLQINPLNISSNRDNPRVLFDEEDLDALKISIKNNGVLVPLTVYKDSDNKDPKTPKYILLDGDRRLRCARKLHLETVPANEIDPPDRLQNILLMFNIHNVRKDWELVPTALKLETIMRLLPKGKETPNQELASITSLSVIRVAECKRILNFDKKYIDMSLDIDPKTRIGGDFFSQLELPLQQLKDFPEITENFSNDKIIDIMIKKYRDGIIVNSTNEFRTLKKILISHKKGVNKKLIVKEFTNFLLSKSTKLQNGEIEPAMTISDLFDKTSFSLYKEKDIIKLTEKLQILLSKYNTGDAKDSKTLTRWLMKLSKSIEKTLERLE